MSTGRRGADRARSCARPARPAATTAIAATANALSIRSRRCAETIGASCRLDGFGATSSVAMTCTSMPFASRTTRLMIDPCVSSVQRDRRLVPSTICVACCAVANATSVAGTSSPTTSCQLPPSSSSNLPVPREQLGRRSGEPVAAHDVRADQIALRATRHARGPADEVAAARARPSPRRAPARASPTSS